jgi:predicted site-specific integrase-resolvase
MTSSKRLIPNADWAALNGVTRRTVFNWERRGIIPKGERICGRLYRDPEMKPMRDEVTNGVAP